MPFRVTFSLASQFDGVCESNLEGNQNVPHRLLRMPVLSVNPCLRFVGEMTVSQCTESSATGGCPNSISHQFTIVHQYGVLTTTVSIWSLQSDGLCTT
jgi:hypothetical protein